MSQDINSPFTTGFKRRGLQPTDLKTPDHVVTDETVIQINYRRRWLYAAIDPDADEFPHLNLRTV